MMIRRILQFPLLVLAVTGMLLGGCATQHDSAPAARPERIWPEPPATPRIRYLNSVYSAEDFGIGKSFWQQLGDFISGPSSTRLVRPMAVVADTQNNIVYVADPGAKGVHRFDLKHSRYRLLRRKDKLPLPSPTHMAAGENGRVYITDSELGQVFVATPDGKRLLPLALDAELKQPTGIVYEPGTGRLYIVDTAAHVIKVFSNNGALVGQFGRRGNAPGEFNYPTSLWQARPGELLVTDSLNFRIQRVDTGGHPLGQFGQAGDASGKLSRPKGVATDRSGSVYVVDAMFHAFQVFDASGKLLFMLGSQGHDAGEFWLPTGIFITADDRIYVSDSHNRRIQIFRYIGGEP